MNAGAVEKLLHRIEDVKEALARRKDAAAKEAFEEVRKAEQMFLDALAEKGMRFEKAKIIGAGEEEEKNTAQVIKDKNIELTDDDLEQYLMIGRKKSTRDRKVRMLLNGKKPILTNEKEIREYINDMIYVNTQGDVRASGRVGLRLAEKVREINESINIEGLYLEFHTDWLKESYNEHLAPKEPGDIALSDADFVNIPKYVNEFDGITSIESYNGTVKIQLYKRTKEGYIRILLIPSKERQSVIVKKILGNGHEKFERKYAKKIERNTKKPVRQTEKTEATIPSTKDRHNYGALSKDSIHDSEPIVKTSDEISSENSSKPVQKSRKATAKPPEVDHLTPMQKQTVANYTRAKIYTKAEALAVVEDMAHFLDENYGFDGGMARRAAL